MGFDWNKKTEFIHVSLLLDYLKFDMINPRKLLSKSNNNETNFLCSPFGNYFNSTCWRNYHRRYLLLLKKKQINQNEAIIISFLSVFVRLWKPIKCSPPNNLRQLIIFTVISITIEMFSVNEHSQRRLIISCLGSFVNKQMQTIDSTISDNQTNHSNYRKKRTFSLWTVRIEYRR